MKATDMPPERQARYLLGVPETVAADIVESNGPTYAALLAAELILAAESVTP
jgi:hypothetical protein